MSMVVNIGQYKEVVRTLIQVKEFVNVPVYVHGHHGIGKSQINGQIAEELDYNFVVLNLANQTPEDLLGFPDGKGGYITPDWLVTDSDRPTFYFLDEINRAPKYVLQCMFNFINEGRIHTHKIPKRDVVLAAGNPSDDNYEVTDFEDKAFLSRFAHFYLEPDPAEYINYLEALGEYEERDGKMEMVESYIHPALTRTIRTSIDSYDNSVKENFRIKSEPDNRSLEKIGRLMKLLDKEWIDKYGVILFAAMVGLDFTTGLMQNWKTMNAIPEPKALLNMKKGQKFTFGETDLDVITTVNGNMASYIQKEVYTDLDKGRYNMSKEQFAALKRYLDYIPRDSEVQFVQDLKNKVGLGNVADFLEKMDEEYLTKLLDVESESK